MRTSASSRTSTYSPPGPARKRTRRPSARPRPCCSAAVFAIVSVVEFTPILWSLSGPLTLFGLTLPRALFWMALVYVFFTTVVAFWIGHPLIRLSFRNELINAAFRYALVRLRDAGEAIGLYRGEGAERGELMTQVRGDHRQLPGVRPPRHRLPRLEQVDERDRRPAARRSSRRRGCSPVRSSSATSRSHRAHSISCRARCRSSAPSTTRSPAIGRPSFASRAGRPPTKRQGSYRH